MHIFSLADLTFASDNRTDDLIRNGRDARREKGVGDLFLASPSCVNLAEVMDQLDAGMQTPSH